LLGRQPKPEVGKYIQVIPEAGFGTPWAFDVVMPDEIPIAQRLAGIWDTRYAEDILPSLVTR
jgi:hypothetical protein